MYRKVQAVNGKVIRIDVRNLFHEISTVINYLNYFAADIWVIERTFSHCTL